MNISFLLQLLLWQVSDKSKLGAKVQKYKKSLKTSFKTFHLNSNKCALISLFTRPNCSSFCLK